MGGTQDIWCTSKGRDSRKIWSMRRERGAQGLCEQGVGGLGGRVERKERRKHRADGESGLEAFQSQSRIHVCPKIIISSIQTLLKEALRPNGEDRVFYPPCHS